MKSKWLGKFIVLCLILLLIMIRYRWLTYPADDIVCKQLYANGDVATKQYYMKQCEIELANHMSFPLAHAIKAILYKGFFSIDQSLNMEETKRLLDVLNDSSSYAWGGVGTFVSNKKIIFYDEHNQIVGYTELEEDNGR